MVKCDPESDSCPPPLKRWATRLYLTMATVIVFTAACDRSSREEPPPAPVSESDPLESPTPEKLAQSAKGYELYCWRERDQIWLTLMIGTNRNKSPEEVFGENHSTQTAGSLNVSSIVSLDAARSEIARLPRGEYLFIYGVRKSSGPELESAEIPQEVLDMVKDVAAECGIEVPQID